MSKSQSFWHQGVMAVTGCFKISAGCLNCWSEKMHKRFHDKDLYKNVVDEGGEFNGNVQFNRDLLAEACKPKGRKVLAIWNDLFHPGLELNDLRDALECIRHHGGLVIVCTKRPGTGVKRLAEIGEKMPDNAVVLVTTENQQVLEERLPHLLEMPARTKGLLIEPCLGPIHFPRIYPGDIHQVILGPENGDKKRPFFDEWGGMVKFQCENASIPFFRKDTGEGTLAWGKALA